MSTLFKAVGMMSLAALLAGGCSESSESATKSTTMTPAPSATTAAPAATSGTGMMDNLSNSSYAQAIRRVIQQKDQVVSQNGGGGAVSPEMGKTLASKFSALDLSGTPAEFQAAFQKVIAALGAIPATSNSATTILPNLSATQWAPLANVTSAITQLEAVCQKYGVTNAGGTLKPF